MPDPRIPYIPAVMNGEGCPGCRTPIWGMRPKQCFMCGYDFENPREEDLLENRAQAELDNLNTQGAMLEDEMDRQRKREGEISAELTSMVEDFLKMDWPDNELLWSEAFKQAAETVWPAVRFEELEVGITKHPTELGKWTKYIRGTLDRPDERIVGFKFEGSLGIGFD